MEREQLVPEKLLKYFQLMKVDEETHTTWGIATAEVPDKANEICDYEEAKKAYQTWSDDFLKRTVAAGQDPSLGNIRMMHGLEIGGKAIKLEFKDVEKQIWLGTTPKDDATWQLIKGGFITGLSQGGVYAWKRKEGDYTRYAPIISEVSFVDNPCLAEASFAYVKANGDIEMRKFASPSSLPEDPELAKLAKLLPTRINISNDSRNDLVSILNNTLKQTNASILITKFAHWNVKGAGFHPTHKLFDEIYELLADSVDTIAERITALGGVAEGLPVDVPPMHYGASGSDTVEVHFKAMADMIGNLSNTYQKAASDAGKLLDLNTQDVYITLGRDVEKQLYFLEATLRDKVNKCIQIDLKKSLEVKQVKEPLSLAKLKEPSEAATKAEEIIKSLLTDAINNRVFGSSKLNKGMYTLANFTDILDQMKYLWLSLEYERNREGDLSPATDDVKELFTGLLEAFLSYAEEEISEAKEEVNNLDLSVDSF